MLAGLILSLYAMSKLGDPIAGAWACSSIRTNGQTSHPCAAQPGLELKPDHTYEWGRETGTWQYSRGALWFSRLRAISRLSPDGKLITEFDRDGTHYVLTFYKWR
jgi:hypothetical protein